MKDIVKPHMIESLQHHRLALLAKTDQVEAYSMRRPNDGHYSINIVWVRGYISLFGDLQIGGPHGCVSAVGYDLKWFAKNRSEGSNDYLCSKFLEKKWQWELCRERLKQELKDFESDDDYGAYSELSGRIREIVNGDYAFKFDEPCEFEVYEALEDVDYCTSDGIPGYAYDPTDAGWLCAINAKFAELYADQDGIFESIDVLNDSAVQQS